VELILVIILVILLFGCPDLAPNRFAAAPSELLEWREANRRYRADKPGIM